MSKVDTVEASIVLDELGLPMARLLVLQTLRSGEMTVSELAAAIGYTRGGVTPHLEALERLGAISSDMKRVAHSFRPARVYRVNAARLEEIAWLVFDAIGWESAHA